MSWGSKMDATYWRRQTPDKPLFPELLWSRPENKNSAGKLLIIGGNAHGFAAPSEAFKEAESAGAGTVHMVLPDSLKQFVGPVFAAGILAPSTPSGSFSQKALAEFLEESAWADGVLLAGDLGRNSETAALLEQFVQKYAGLLTITRDAVDYFKNLSNLVFQRPRTTVVLSLAQLQRLCVSAQFTTPITFSMDLIHLVEALHELTQQFPANIIVKHLENVFVASSGQVSTTHLPEAPEIWRLKTATHAAVWWLQNSGKTFEALSTAIHQTD